MVVQFVPGTGAPVAAGPGGTSVEPRQRRLWLRSLTSKLVTGVVVLVVVLVVLVGGLTWFSLRQFLDSRLDQQLEATANGSLRSLFSGGSQPGPAVRAPQDVWAVALSPSGGFVAYPYNSGVEPMKLSAQDRVRIAKLADGSTSTVETTDGDQLRVTVRPATAVSTSGDTEAAVAVVGLSTAEEERTLRRLVNVELIIGAGAVVLAFAATTLGVRRSLRNLYKVTGTAREVTAELSPEGAGLDRRVPVVEEGTEVGQLAESVNTLLSAVETQFAARVESEERMRQFLADASHELRTPLTSIRGFAELARMQRAVGEDSEDNLDRIESEGTRMSRLVEDLLLLARGDDPDGAPGHTDEPVDLGGVVDDVVAAARAGFPERRIDVQLEPTTTVRGDRDQLFRVVRNLVTNACVHTAGAVLVRCHPDGSDVVVQVLDGGPGLPAEDAAQVFDRFWRADKARTRARGGSGLGMSIVAALVRAHGGTVTFESAVETGSTVTVRLPATVD